MIKNLISFIFVFLLMSPAFADNCDFLKYCPAVPKSHKTVSQITGLNWITQKIAQGIIKQELKKETKGKFSVRIKATGTLDLINGKFTDLNIIGKNLNMDGVHISEFSTNTVCKFNSVKLNKNSILFKENMVMNYQIKVSESDFSQTLIDTGYISTLKKMGIPVNDVKAQFRNNKIYFIFEIPTFITKPIQLTISSGISVKSGKIQLTELQTSNNSFINTKNLIKVLEKTNPIAFTSDIMNNKNSKVYIDSANIENNNIAIKGLVFIPKNTER